MVADNSVKEAVSDDSRKHTMTTTNSGLKKKKSKKRKISKHIADAENAKNEDNDMKESNEKDLNETLSQQVESDKKKSSNKKNRQRENHHVKDPNEAAQYLKIWKEDKKSWKFNKNTQSWLIRHMYDSDKVSKSTFSILLEYLQGGKSIIDRILQDASKRAIRYQEYLKSNNNRSVDANNEGEKDSSNIDDSLKTTTKKAGNDNNNITSQENNNDNWATSDDHGKRKEYKRARKVIETLSK